MNYFRFEAKKSKNLAGRRDSVYYAKAFARMAMVSVVENILIWLQRRRLLQVAFSDPAGIFW
jgi:hypothetical protein